MNELALFSGAGGGILGGQLLGWRTVCAVERDAYAAQILAQRQNDGLAEVFPIWSDICSFDGKPWRGIVDVVSGGFPCQDISSAGRGAGITGKRSGMWKEMARVIGEVRPLYAFVENSPLLSRRGLGTVLADLAAMGFDAEWGVLSAAQVGANHRRERIWIVARQRNFFSYPHHKRLRWGKQQQKGIKETSAGRHPQRQLANADLCGHQDGQVKVNATEARLNAFSEFGAGSTEMANTHLPRFKTCNDQASRSAMHALEKQSRRGGHEFGTTQHWWEAEPDVGRVADGVAHRVDRLKAIGNGQVPLCAATAFKLLKARLK